MKCRECSQRGNLSLERLFLAGLKMILSRFEGNELVSGGAPLSHRDLPTFTLLSVDAKLVNESPSVLTPAATAPVVFVEWGIFALSFTITKVSASLLPQSMVKYNLNRSLILFLIFLEKTDVLWSTPISSKMSLNDWGLFQKLGR